MASLLDYLNTEPGGDYLRSLLGLGPPKQAAGLPQQAEAGGPSWNWRNGLLNSENLSPTPRTGGEAAPIGITYGAGGPAGGPSSYTPSPVTTPGASLPAWASQFGAPGLSIPGAPPAQAVPPANQMPVSLAPPPPEPASQTTPPVAPQQQGGGSFGDRLSMALSALVNPSTPFTYDALRQSGVPHANALLQATNLETAQANMPTWGIIGQDDFGTNKYGWINRATGQIAVPSAGSGLGMLDAVDKEGNPLMGQDYLTHLEKTSPSMASLVKAVLRGDASAVGRNLQKAIPAATRVDPNFTGMADYQTRLQTAKSFAAGGKDAEVVKSYNQAIIHANKAWDLIPKIEGVNVGGSVGKLINAPYGEARAATNPQFASDRKEYENLINALSGELMKASRATGRGSLEEIRNWQKGSLSANSGAEMRGAIRGGMDFLEGAMSATSEKKSQGLKSQFEPTSLLTEDNRKAFHRISGSSEGGTPQKAAPSTGWTVRPL